MLIETKSSFLNHLLLWVVTVTLFGLVFLPFFMSPVAFEVSIEEVRYFRSLGRDTSAVTESANNAYKAIFDDSGATQVIDAFFHRNNRQDNERAGIAKGVDWARRWMDNFTRMVYRGIWREIALWPIYIAGILSICIPAVVDGLAVRAKKKYDFLQSNPVFFYGAAHAVSLVLGLAFFVPIAPMAIDSTMLTICFMAVALSLWIATANLQTGQ